MKIFVNAKMWNQHGNNGRVPWQVQIMASNALRSLHSTCDYLHTFVGPVNRFIFPFLLFANISILHRVYTTVHLVFQSTINESKYSGVAEIQIGIDIMQLNICTIYMQLAVCLCVCVRA